MKQTLATLSVLLVLSALGCQKGPEDSKTPATASDEKAPNGDGEESCEGHPPGPPSGEGPHRGGPHAGGPHAPPPEAFTACDGKAQSDACSVQLGDKSLEGTCEGAPEGAEDTRLSCRPAGPPPGEGPHAGGRPPGPPRGGEQKNHTSGQAPQE